MMPEQKLWRAVLEQAYEDAEAGQFAGVAFAAVDAVPDTQARAQGRRFLRADTPLDAAVLRLVCDYAGVPADRVISWARRHYPLAA